ncbi:MAG: FliM/FliN family flagellar motor switch protein [Pseudomonadota bacterium]
MNMAQSFAPARALAQHCAELTACGPRPEDRSEFLAAWRRDVGRSLSEGLGSLLAGGRLSVSISEPEWCTGEQIFERIGGVAANSLLRCGETERTILLSFDCATAVALTDRSFGGDGAMPDDVPEQLPRSASLLIDQVATIVAQSITEVSSGEEGTSVQGDVIVRSESAARLKPFDPATSCASLEIQLQAESGQSWKALIAMPSDRLDSMLPGLGSSTKSGAKPGQVIGPGEGPFGAIPLPIKAVLAEFELSLGKLDRLAPGDHIPLAVAREVPLRTGSKLVAHGSVGTLEDRMAIRLTRISQGAANT